MAWYCDRCGEKQGIFDTKYNSKNDANMQEHEIPNFINICGSCHNYLFPVFKDDFVFRFLSDDNFLEDSISDKESRFYEKSRKFDVEYIGFDPDTNLYLNESYDGVVDHINSLIRRFEESSPYMKWEEHFEKLKEKFKQSYNDLDEYYENEDDDGDDFEDDSLVFDDGANEKISDALHEKSTTAWYESLKEDAINSYETRFAASLQNFVTRLGLIISEVANRKFYGTSHYSEILDYICHQIIEDDYLYKKLIKINKKANASKHTKGNVDVDVNQSLTTFNSMIDKLVSVSNCDAFEICHVYNRKTTTEVECSCCGRINPKKYYRCKACKKIVCDECFNREKKMCCECASDIND